MADKAVHCTTGWPPCPPRARSRVPLPELKSAMEDWFRRKGYLLKDAALVVTES